MVIPCYNEEKSIEKTVLSLLESDYSNLKKIIIVDDCSTDNSYAIAKNLEKKYPRVLAVQTPKNTGKASGSKNYGAGFVNTDLIGFTDADSYVAKDSISKMIGFFDDKKNAGVTSSVLVYNKQNLLAKLQAFEYQIIAFTRKLLDFIEGIYVTPGPLALYKKSVFDLVGGFDEENLTEDIEITWNFVQHGYVIAMSLSSTVHSIVPEKIKDWFKQRIRWNLGGIQTIVKYKKTFLKSGMLGWFIIPFFVFSWFIGITGLGLLIYKGMQKIIIAYLDTKYSIASNVAIVTMDQFTINPSILAYMGIAIFAVSVIFTIIGLIYMRQTDFKNPKILYTTIYMFAYLLAYPPLLIISMYKYLRKKKTW